MSNKHFVATYGTLKKRPNSTRNPLGLPDNAFVGKAISHDKFVMGGYGFPKAVHPDYFKDQDMTQYEGKLDLHVWEVDDHQLGQMDSYEGYPHFYDREVIQVENIGGELVSAWMYIAKDAADGFYSSQHAKNEMCIPNSDGIVSWPEDLKEYA